jgi:hypothetical protein
MTRLRAEETDAVTRRRPPRALVVAVSLLCALGASVRLRAQGPVAATRLATSEPRYFEVGAFRQPPTAVALWAALTKAGFVVDLLLEEEVTRVIIGPQCTAQDTAAVEAALVRNGFSYAVTVKPQSLRPPSCATATPPASAAAPPLLAASQVTASTDFRAAGVPRPPDSRSSGGGVSFPGVFATRVAYSSPVERRNLLSVTSIEQGFSLWTSGPHAVVPYAALRAGVDQHGFDWNNKAVGQLGVKYVRAFSHGVVQLGAGYAYERRLETDFRAGQPMAFGNYWFGWSPFEPGRRSFPGSTWGAVGNDQPAEGDNIIGTFYVDQGVTVVSLGRLGIIPFVELTISADSERRSWNSFRMFGEGIKVLLPIPGGTIEAGTVYRQERRWLDGSSAEALGGFANFRYGWRAATSTSQ